MLASAEKVIWKMAEDRLKLQAGLLCRYFLEDGQIFVEVVSSLNVPAAPLNGSQNKDVCNVVRECLKVPKAHEHNIDNWALAHILKRLNGALHKASIVMFCHVAVEDEDFCFLGFPKDNKRQNSLSAANGVCMTLAELAYSRRRILALDDRLTTMSLYIREVGHDLAGSIHAIVAKMAYISKGPLNESGMKIKATEAWREVQNAHAIAECLGIAVDPDYALGNSESVTIEQILKEVTREQEADLKKNNIAIKVGETLGLKVNVVKLHFKLAIANIVKNAVKYSYSDTIIEIITSREDDRIVISVSNVGIGLPVGEERLRIWDFGYRCDRAKKLNVNGSGIGLFTCKKVILQHGGLVWVDEDPRGTIFHASLPVSRVVYPPASSRIRR
ncbi:MAG: ATP-binding protein [Alphaproteobacteria bacterium]|nr:MAG: ATP-binding protein [Alphaproteobacteria bacterium]